jgi:hypothetical protein
MGSGGVSQVQNLAEYAEAHRKLSTAAKYVTAQEADDVNEAYKSMINIIKKAVRLAELKMPDGTDVKFHSNTIAFEGQLRFMGMLSYCCGMLSFVLSVGWVSPSSLGLCELARLSGDIGKPIAPSIASWDT